MSEQDWRNMSVDLFGFSRDAQIVLEKNDIKTLGELVKCSRVSLRRRVNTSLKRDGSGSWGGLNIKNPELNIHNGIKNILYVLQKMGLGLCPSDTKGSSSKNREMVAEMVKNEKKRGVLTPSGS